LKLYFIGALLPWRYVAPHAGAWIETNLSCILPDFESSRPPRGGVD